MRVRKTQYLKKKESSIEVQCLLEYLDYNSQLWFVRAPAYPELMTNPKESYAAPSDQISCILHRNKRNSSFSGHILLAPFVQNTNIYTFSGADAGAGTGMGVGCGVGIDAGGAGEGCSPSLGRFTISPTSFPSRPTSKGIV